MPLDNCAWPCPLSLVWQDVYPRGMETLYAADPNTQYDRFSEFYQTSYYRQFEQEHRSFKSFGSFGAAMMRVFS